LNLLRDDRLVTLHDLVEACRASSQHCLLAAELMPEDPRAEALHDLGERRSRDADFFGERMVAEDDIPGGPPAELSFIETALARARAAFGDEGLDALLADCRERELAVLKEAEAACHGPLRDDEKAAAGTLARDAAERLDSLFKR
jgi:hypothetical protein